MNQQVLERVINGITRFPENFHLHPKLRGFVDKRRDVIAKGGNLDWAFGEALAFGTLALEGTAVRLSGQDSGRGTSSAPSRVYSETGKRYVPTQHISRIRALKSSTVRSVVRGAGLRIRLLHGRAGALMIWEAQFGDSLTARR